jgi:hypothetical protein
MHDHGVEPIDRDPASELNPSASQRAAAEGFAYVGFVFSGVRRLGDGDTLSA